MIITISFDNSTSKHLVLFVSNLHYDVTEKELEEHLRVALPVRKVTIFYKADGTSSGKGQVLLRNYSVGIEHRLNHTKFKGRFMRFKLIYDRDNITGSRTALVYNLPHDIKAGELKAHFRPPLQAKRATIFYNEDGSSTGRGAVVFSYFLNYKVPRAELCLQSVIKGKSMKYSLLIETDLESAASYLEENFTIYITGLPYNVTSDGLKKLFSATFDVVEASIFCNKDGSSTGTGEVVFCCETTSAPCVLKFVQSLFSYSTTTVFCMRDKPNTSNSEGCTPSEKDEQRKHLEKYFEEDRVMSQASNHNDNAIERGGYRNRMNEISGLELTWEFRNRPKKLREFNSFAGLSDSYKAIQQLTIPQRDCAIYVTNLHVDVTSEELKAYFCTEIITIVNAYIIVKKDGTSTEAGLVIFSSRRDRLSAFLSLDNKEFKGRPIKMTCIYGGSVGCWEQPTGK